MNNLISRLARLERGRVISPSPEQEAEREAMFERSLSCLAPLFGLEATKENGEQVLRVLIENGNYPKAN